MMNIGELLLRLLVPVSLPAPTSVLNLPAAAPAPSEETASVRPDPSPLALIWAAGAGI